MNDKIELKLTKYGKFSICCVACNRITEAPLVAAEGRANDGQGVVICPHCLSEGDIEVKLERHARKLQARAQWLRDLIGRLALPSRKVLKEFTDPEDAERITAFWNELGEFLKLDLPADQAAHRAASLLHEVRGLWPLIKSDVETEPEHAAALERVLEIRRAFFGAGADQ